MWLYRSSLVLLLSLAAVSGQMDRSSGLFKMPNATALHDLNDRLEGRLPNGATQAPTDSPTETPPSPSPSEAPTNTPTAAPTPLFNNPPCSICGEGDVGNPNATISLGNGIQLTCAVYDGLCMSGGCNPATCEEMANFENKGIVSICGCPTPPPTEMPSFAPSTLPSSSPSASPTDKPSTLPSSAPSYSPTKETQKTKSSVNEIMLVNIPREMDDLTLARFEIATLEFIKQAQPPTKGYN
ncbi:MAG: hypothetical protein SGARI_006972, partial [Bacillariaceae sp.]